MILKILTYQSFLKLELVMKGKEYELMILKILTYQSFLKLELVMKGK